MEPNAEMFAELLKVAEQQLPKATSDLLRVRLDKLDSLERDYDNLKASYEVMGKLNDQLSEKIKGFEAIENKEQHLIAKEAELKAREDDLWKANMNKELECLKIINTNVIEFTRGLIRNTEFRKEVFESGGYYDQTNNYRSSNNNVTETTKPE